MTTFNIKIVIQGNTVTLAPGLKQGSKLLQLANIQPPQQLLLEIKGDIDIPINAEDRIIIDGGEVFSIGDGDPPIIDNPCLRKPIRFKFNGQNIAKETELTHAKILGSELKAFDPNGDPSDGLFADLDGIADEPIRDEWQIVIQKGDEFITTPCGNVGDNAMPDGIVANHLADVKKVYPLAEWHSHPAGSALLIPNVNLHSHWSLDKTDLLIIVPNGYPIAALDMFYVSPHITLHDGSIPEAGNSFETHLGKQWQRFSWHYHSRKWLPAKDSLLSHIEFCLFRLKMAK